MIRGGKAYRQHKTFKEAIRERDNNTCQTCGGKLGEHGIRQLDVAHIVPYAECGTTTPDNVRLLCHSCNKHEQLPQRNARLPIEDYWQHLEEELARST